MALSSLAERPATTPTEAARDRSAPGKVTGKLLIAMRAMVWEGATRCDAATKAGISEHSLYVALRKAHVRQWYLAEIDVLRTSEKARNIFTLAEVRDQKTNQMARVAAVKALEQLDDQPANAAARAQSPGFIIQVIQAVGSTALMPHQQRIEPKPLISLEPGRDDD